MKIFFTINLILIVINFNDSKVKYGEVYYHYFKFDKIPRIVNRKNHW